jgi:hypothetical protein
MVDDEAFFDKVWPLVRAWQRPVSYQTAEQRASMSRGSAALLRTPTLIRQQSQSRQGWMLLVAAVIVGGLVIAKLRAGGGPPAFAPVTRVAPVGEYGRTQDSMLKLAQLPSPTIISADSGVPQEVTLADSTTVLLHPHSWIAYSDPRQAERGGDASVPARVLVGGEAEIRVRRTGHPLTVVTPKGSITIKPGESARVPF